MQIGQQVDENLSYSGAEHLFWIKPKSNGCLITLRGTNHNELPILFIKKGALPDVSDFDIRREGSLEVTAILNPLNESEYYIKIANSSENEIDYKLHVTDIDETVQSTPTRTPTATSTPTNTPTNTLTPTITITPTISPTITITPFPTSCSVLLSSPGKIGVTPEVATDPFGNVHIIWKEEGGKLMYTRLGPDNTIDIPAKEIYQAASFSYPRIAMDTRGDAHIILRLGTGPFSSFVYKKVSDGEVVESNGITVLYGLGWDVNVGWPSISVNPKTNLPSIAFDYHVYIPPGPIEIGYPWDSIKIFLPPDYGASNPLPWAFFWDGIWVMSLDESGEWISGSSWIPYVVKKPLTPFTGFLKNPEVIFDQSGQAHCVWMHQEVGWSGPGIAYAKQGEDKWHELTNEDTRDVLFLFGGPEIAFSEDGSLDIVWTRDNGPLVWKRMNASGLITQYDPMFSIKGSAARYPNVSVSDSQNAVAAWTDHNQGQIYIKPLLGDETADMITCQTGTAMSFDISIFEDNYIDCVWQEKREDIYQVYHKRIEVEETSDEDIPDGEPDEEPDLDPATLIGIVIQMDNQGQPVKPFPGVTVDASGAGSVVTGDDGKFSLTVQPGSIDIVVSKNGFYTIDRNIKLRPGETRSEIFELIPEGELPVGFNFQSPYGRHFIDILPSPIPLSIDVAWNGTPGTVVFVIGEKLYNATLEHLRDGISRASIDMEIPTFIDNCMQPVIDITNGEGLEGSYSTTNVFFHPYPEILDYWDSKIYLHDILKRWQEKGKAFLYDDGFSLKFPDPKLNFYDLFKFQFYLGFERRLRYDFFEGLFTHRSSAMGGIDMESKINDIELLVSGGLKGGRGLNIVFQKCNQPNETPFWKFHLFLRGGCGAPVTVIFDFVFPQFSLTFSRLRSTPIIGDILKALKLRLFFTFEGILKAEYEKEGNRGMWGATGLFVSVRPGIEGHVLVKSGLVNAEAGVYVGGKGIPEFQIHPELKLTKVGYRVYIGLYARWGLFKKDRKESVDIVLDFDKNTKSVTRKIIKHEILDNSEGMDKWERLSSDFANKRPANRLHFIRDRKSTKVNSLESQFNFKEQILIENVSRISGPSIVSTSNDLSVFFPQYDPMKPAYAATDIMHTHLKRGEKNWLTNRVTDDMTGEYSPNGILTSSGDILTVWERVIGDVSEAVNPEDEAPYYEIMLSRYDQDSDNWSIPIQLTKNSLYDHSPIPISYGNVEGILWIQNVSSDLIGNATNGDRLMFSQFNGEAWTTPLVLWAGDMGIYDFAFISDDSDEGHIAFVVDEDGEPDSVIDREIYILNTTNGVWESSVPLTVNDVEDNSLVFVSPQGKPMLIWKSGDTLKYKQLGISVSKDLFPYSTLETYTLTLSGTTLPDGAAIAYSVQNASGMDIVTSFYDTTQDLWSLPRLLTQDEAVESSISACAQGDQLILGYMKTETEWVSEEVEINGEKILIDNIPQPGIRNICVLSHTLYGDLAVMEDSIRFSDMNPTPGEVVSVTAVIENLGDLAYTEIPVVFYDENPEAGGTIIDSTKIISKPLVGGATATVSVTWNVPHIQQNRRIYVIVDPDQVFKDRDRTNNIKSRLTIFPDIEITRFFSTKIGNESYLLTASLLNTGVIPSGSFTVALRIESATGNIIDSQSIKNLPTGVSHDLMFSFSTNHTINTSESTQVFVEADLENNVHEDNEENNLAFLVISNTDLLYPTETQISPTPIIPTPVPVTLFTENFNDTESLIISSVEGFDTALIYVDEQPTGAVPDGTGLVIEADLNQGALCILNTPVSYDEGPVVISVWVRTEGPDCSIGLVGLNSPIDGQLGYTLVTGPDVPIGEWKKLFLMYDPPNDIVQPAIQVVALESAMKGVKVYIDNLEIRPLSTDNYEEINLDIDGSFDQDTAGMITNVNGDSGEVLLVPDDEGGKQILLSIDESDIAANIGVFASQLQDGFPQFIKASVESQLVNGPEGTTALVMTNGYTDVGMFIHNSHLPLTSEQPQILSIGGLFETENPDMPIFCVVQNGGPSLQSEIIIDNLELKRLIGEM